MVLVMVEMSPKVNMITIKKVNPRVALSVSDYASKYARTAHLSMTPYTLFVSNVLPDKTEATYIARGMLISGLMASSAMDGSIPVAEKQ